MITLAIVVACSTGLRADINRNVTGPALGSCPSDGPPSGSDLLVADLPEIENYDAQGGVEAFSYGSTVCNLGDQPASWDATGPNHPVISQNLFRLSGGRFEQIGMSWVKHGFIVAEGTVCCADCAPETTQSLGVGCSDSYRADLNGAQEGLGPRSEVDPHTGVVQFPYNGIGQTGDTLFKRLQVAQDVLEAGDADALYFAEIQYLSAEDSSARHQDNNASYRQTAVFQNESDWVSTFQNMPDTVRGSPAIRAWRSQDPEVMETDIRVPDEGLLIMAARTTALDDGFWRYEYALHNLNSTRAAGAFCVPLPPDSSVREIGFHDIDHHSGEVYDTTDWQVQQCASSLQWHTATFEDDPQANALRWGTLYNFWFETDAEPAAGTARVSLFIPGTPEAVSVVTRVPSGGVDSACTEQSSDAGGAAPQCGAGRLAMATLFSGLCLGLISSKRSARRGVCVQGS